MKLAEHTNTKGDLIDTVFYLFDGGKTTLCQCLRLHVAYAKKTIQTLWWMLFSIFKPSYMPSFSWLTFDGNVDNQKFRGNNVSVWLFDTMWFLKWYKIEKYVHKTVWICCNQNFCITSWMFEIVFKFEFLRAFNKDASHL